VADFFFSFFFARLQRSLPLRLAGGRATRPKSRVAAAAAPAHSPQRDPLLIPARHCPSGRPSRSPPAQGAGALGDLPPDGNTNPGGNKAYGEISGRWRPTMSRPDEEMRSWIRPRLVGWGSSFDRSQGPFHSKRWAERDFRGPEAQVGAGRAAGRLRDGVVSGCGRDKLESPDAWHPVRKPVEKGCRPNHRLSHVRWMNSASGPEGKRGESLFFFS
jgi:hypothetical protein